MSVVNHQSGAVLPILRRLPLNLPAVHRHPSGPRPENRTAAVSWRATSFRILA
jgi:hypothetical protein